MIGLINKRGMDKYTLPNLQDGTWEKIPLDEDGLLDLEGDFDQDGFYLETKSFGVVSLEIKIGTKQIWRRIGTEDEYCEVDTFLMIRNP